MWRYVSIYSRYAADLPWAANDPEAMQTIAINNLYFQKLWIYLHKLCCGMEEMILNTTLVYTKGGRMIVLNEIELDFTVLNNKSFSLKNTPVRPMNFIYKIIDYGKMVNHFSYKFEGAGTQPDINEKIEDYLQTGVVSILTSAAEGPVKWFSVLFFIIGLVFLIAFKDDINYFLTKDFTGLLLPGLPVAAFIGVSFIFDIILIVDKIQEKIYRGYNER